MLAVPEVSGTAGGFALLLLKSDLLHYEREQSFKESALSLVLFLDPSFQFSCINLVLKFIAPESNVYHSCQH